VETDSSPRCAAAAAAGSRHQLVELVSRIPAAVGYSTRTCVLHESRKKVIREKKARTLKKKTHTTDCRVLTQFAMD
jgi:hypothetical protein